MNSHGYPKTRSAGGIVLNSRGEILVVSQEGTSWSLPKGHLMETESALSAAMREIYEETGIKHITLVKELGSYSRPAESAKGTPELKTITMFLFTSTELDLNPRDPANPLALWVRPASVAKMLSNPVDRAFFDGVVNQLGTEEH